MNKENIWSYISRKLANESTLEEEKIIGEWVEEEEVNKLTLEYLEQVWKNNTPQKINTNSIYNTLHHRISSFNRKEKKTRVLYYFTRIAAALLLLVASSFLVHHFLTRIDNEEIAFHEVHVPRGSRSSILLADGTKVWLSNDSKLVYPSEFHGEERKVELQGEAYFEVTHNENEPFIVNIGENRIKVLGTVFSVMAYPNDNIVKTDLISGKVQFQIKEDSSVDHYHTYTLSPNESIVLDRNNGKLYQSEVLTNFYEYWEKGVYVFNNESLESLAKKIARIYNVEVIFENESLKEKRFSGVMSINDNIFTFFEAIKRTSIEPINYKFEKNKVYMN
ncbi:FecR domain-containing protein [Draconibacterium sp. IB214405]|uniref:FecR family protein n=1 Tax=Draconibacterium sp. IB214405 TaxID=3097352 RepID=UPI002A148D23|nr:FecR domain-containing protein [Draconibacterium sp. IB214405]MDX8339344.1 FecR domain-containing protein [Draconibacterium sp. IB214405]